MTTARLIIVCGSMILLDGCAEEPLPRSVDEFLENRILLEATMVRCGENRNESKYDAECVNAREAINRIAVEEEKKRRKDLEAQFERKRKSLRRTQEAAAEARRRAAEARRRREEAEYLGVYDDGTPATGIAGDTGSEPVTDEPEATTGPPVPEQPAEPPDAVGQDLEAIREELRRRQESGQPDSG